MKEIISNKIAKIEEFINDEIESLGNTINNNGFSMEHKISRIRASFSMLDYKKGKLDALKALLRDIEIENAKESKKIKFVCHCWL